jgi:ribosomal protein S4E
MENKENTITKYYCNQKVRITKGFNRGQTGTIKDFNNEKESTVYEVEVTNKINGKTKVFKVNENFLKTISILPF